MSNFIHGVAISFALLCSVFTTQMTRAADTISMEEITAHVSLAGLAEHEAQATRTPVIDQYRLSDKLREKISSLVRRKEELVTIRDGNKMSVGDYIFAIIMPGGLLYAGYKKREYYLAKKDLAEVNDEIDRHVNDLDAMQTETGSIVLAPHHLVEIDGSGQRF